MKIRVVTNAAIDLPEDLLEEYNIAKIPHIVFFDDKEWKLDVDISTHDFYELLKTQKIIPPTSNPEPIDFSNVFESSFKDQKYDHIFCVTAAQALGSSTYSAAKMAARQFKEQITLIDTESASGVQGLIALNILELAEKGKTVEEITEIIENLKKDYYFIGGFHTPMEKECLAILLRGKQPVIICPARSLERMRLPSGWLPGLSEGRLLLLSPFEQKHKRLNAKLAAFRNEFVAACSPALLAV